MSFPCPVRSPSSAAGTPRSALVLALLTVVAACDPSGPPGEGVVLLTIGAAGSPHARLAHVQLSAPDGIRVTYQADEPDPLVIEVTEAAGIHEVGLPRLRPGVAYQVFVEALTIGDATASASFQTAPLPQDLAALDFATEGSLSASLALIEINRNADGFEGVIAVDEHGEVVWHHRAEAVAGTARRPNGDFVILSGVQGVIQVDPVHGVVHTLHQRPEGLKFHHDVIATPWNTLYVLSHDTMTVGSELIVGEAIWEWTPETGSLAKRWSAFDHLDYASDQGWGTRASDWLHANAIAIGPAGNVLMSLAFLDQVLSLEPDFSAIEWRLGGPNADLPATGDLAFHLQHTAAEIPSATGRRVILFDNGEQERGYSRALELAIDPSAGTVEHAWEFRAPNDNRSAIVSLARRMENGNTFVAFGAAEGIGGSHGPVEAYEVEPDGAIRWRMQVSGYPAGSIFIMYRAAPTHALAGERPAP